VDRLTSMKAFAKVASARSFSRAAQELGVSQGTVSTQVHELERWLGVRLLHRTTRRVALTDAGATFLAQCIRILDAMEAAGNSARPAEVVSGSMRISVSVVFGSTRLVGLIVEFLDQHPRLSVKVEVTERPVNPVDEGFDMAIHTRPIEGRDLVSYRLMTYNSVLTAAPSYLARHGVPSSLADLAKHECIARTDNSRKTWVFLGPGGEFEVPINARLQANNALLRREVALGGVGVLLCADYLVANDIAAGRLTRLLPDHTSAARSVRAICPIYRASSPGMRGLIDHLTTRLGG
jgi:DNA-binding transcriptional LysR family regulator